MKIVELRVTPIVLRDPPLRCAMGLHQPYALRAIIQLFTDNGLVGLSETYGGKRVLDELAAAREHVVGSDPYSLNVLETLLSVRAFGIIEVACLDLIGQATGRPVCDLLGGRFRERVPFSAYLFYKHEGTWGEGFHRAEALSAEGIVAQAQEMCGKYGFQSLKLKAGVLPPDEEVRTIFALREAFGPETPLRIDPNGVWSVETAIEQGQKLKGVLEYYEDPVRGKEAMAQVSTAVGIPMATNMCTTSFADFPESIRLGAIQILLSDHHVWGGLLNSVKAAKICDTWGIGLSMHSNSHVGISLLAMTHLAAAVPNLTYACDTHYPWQPDEVIVGGKLAFENGELAVPTAPGLGATLDEDALGALHEEYLRAGITERDDVIEMQKIEPGWRPRTW